MGLTNNLGKLSNMITSTGTAVGVGTSSPGAIFDINIPNVVNTDLLRFSNSAGGSGDIAKFQYGPSGQFILNLLSNASANRNFGILNGNVGIGTSSPITNLHIRGNTTSVIYAVGASNAFRAEYQVEAAGQFTGSFVANPSASSTYGGIPTSTIGISTSSTAFVIATSEVERMRITSGGNIGIGTTNPTAKLTLYGGEMRWGFTSDFGALSFTDGKPMLASVGAIDFLFYTNAAERMRITSGGQVQIRQAGNTFVDGLRLLNNAFNNWGLVSGGDNNFYFGYNSSSVSRIETSGAYVQLSDINKKKDFEQSTIGLKEVLGLKPTLYKMKSEDENTEKHLGFIAQEVKEYIPQAYKESTNGEDTFVGLTEMPIIAALVKAIQELSAKVSALENKS
jgi:hypothetical protein